MNYFAKNLEFLTKTSISQSELARRLELPRQNITKYLKGQEPKYDKLIKISEIYNVSIDDLLKKDLSNYKI